MLTTEDQMRKALTPHPPAKRMFVIGPFFVSYNKADDYWCTARSGLIERELFTITQVVQGNDSALKIVLGKFLLYIARLSTSPSR